MIKRWLLKKIDKYSVVSFDIFDTLIERTVLEPTEVFAIIEKDMGQIKDFYQKRVQGERNAREKSVGGEVTLQEIYEEIDFENTHILKQYMEYEVTVERRICIPKESMAEVYEKAVKQGKRIYLVSDMYLPGETIKHILQKCNINKFDGLYISNEYGVNKISGKLFEKVINENRLLHVPILHIGDSFKADYKGAKKYGLHPVLIWRKGKIKGKIHKIFKRK